MRFFTCILLVAVLGTALLLTSVAADTTAGNGSGYITVINLPVAGFYTSIRYGPPPFTVSFADTSQGFQPMTYHWDFGDGTNSAMQNPTHTYLSSGEYTVSLTVTNQFGSGTRTVADFIWAGYPPEANFSALPSEGIIPLTVAFTDLSKNTPADWTWDFGDGTTSSEQNPVHTYTQTGIYDVRLKVSSDFGSDALSRTHYINASLPAPVPVPVPVTPVKAHAGGIVGLIQDAKGTTDKNLPTAAFIPPQFMALAAVLTSLAVVFIQFLLVHIGSLAQLGAKVAKFFADLAGGHAIEKISDKEIEAREIKAERRERPFFGLSAVEILVLEAAVIMVAVAFLLADRAALTLQMVLIYILVGAVSVILHDFAHRYFANRYGHDTDIQFWGLGTVIMFLTAWLYGNAFAQSYRNIVERDEDAEETRELGIEMVAGPVISIVLTLVFLFMVQFGGIWAIAGGLGFSINLITAVYSLIPISTMDGSAIWKWNRALYLVLFIPLVAFYFFTYMLV
ncbi:MAG: PKD domain-containing protein [Methanoregula sp.]|uniref:PKD domain-containing protein n=2 Tax=Methanoregula sp. TaxID=2052170 RepID=UPI003BB03480